MFAIRLPSIGIAADSIADRKPPFCRSLRFLASEFFFKTNSLSARLFRFSRVFWRLVIGMHPFKMLTQHSRIESISDLSADFMKIFFFRSDSLLRCCSSGMCFFSRGVGISSETHSFSDGHQQNGENQYDFDQKKLQVYDGQLRFFVLWR